MHAMSHPFLMSNASAMTMPSQSDRALVGAPAINAPASAGIDSRFNDPYFVSGICCIRRYTTVAIRTPIAIG